MREAIAFALYLPGLEMTLAAKLYSPATGERQMLFEHLECLAPGDLLVLDRGYPSRWLIAHLTLRGIPFCIRADDSGFSAVKAFLRSTLPETVVALRAADAVDCADYECAPTPTTVRLVRVVTPNGRVHASITSLLDATAFPAEGFADLNHSRWRIEEAFKRLKRLKHRMALENTSGLSWLAAQQDFGAKVLADNLRALAVLEATALSNTPEQYKLNRTYAFAHLKRCLPRWLLAFLPSGQEVLAAFEKLVRNLIRFVPGATNPSPVHAKTHRKHAYKSTC